MSNSSGLGLIARVSSVRNISVLDELVARYLTALLIAVLSPCTIAQVKNDKEIAYEIALILNSQLSTARVIASNQNKFLIDVNKAGQIADNETENICQKFWQQFVEGRLQVPKSALMSATNGSETEQLAKVVKETTAAYLEATRVKRTFGPETTRAVTAKIAPKRAFDDEFALAKKAFDRRWNSRLGPTGRFSVNSYHLLFSDLLLPSGQPSLLVFSIDLEEKKGRPLGNPNSSSKLLAKFKWEFFRSDGSSSGNSLLSWSFANEPRTNEEGDLAGHSHFDYAGIVMYPVARNRVDLPVVWVLRGETGAPLFSAGNGYFSHELRTYLLTNRESYGSDPLHSCRILFN